MVKIFRKIRKSFGKSESECADMYVVDSNLDVEEDSGERQASLEEIVRQNSGLCPPEDKVDHQYEVQLMRWRELYDKREHIRLQTAVMNHLVRQYIGHQQNKLNH